MFSYNELLLISSNEILLVEMNWNCSLFHLELFQHSEQLFQFVFEALRSQCIRYGLVVERRDVH